MIAIRPVTSDDCRTVWEWSNDPIVRTASFQSLPIPWERHEQWFRDKLADRHCRYFMVVDEGRPVGQMRFELADGEAEVHIDVSASERSRGKGTEALRLGCGMLRAEGFGRRVVARIKPDNLASIRLFERVGFVRAGRVLVGSDVAERMVLESPS